VQEDDLTTDQIYNTKKISSLLHCLPKKNLTGGNEKFADGFKLSKEQLTLLQCANSNDTNCVKLLGNENYQHP
jgi:hypothetical protein